MNCLECDCPIQKDVYNYSTDYFGVPLCRTHQNWVKKISQSITITEEAIILYFLLRENNVPAELEKYDGFKTVDIVIEEAKVHIEIDGGHHNYNHRQALADLKRTYHSFRNGYLTLRIPNSLIKNDPEETAAYITDFLVLNRDRNMGKIKKGFSKFKLFK